MSNQSTKTTASLVRETFLRALELPSEERAHFLETACLGDKSIRVRVEELLAEHETVGDFLDKPATRPVRALPASERPGDIIDRYRLVEKIGEGGAGVVYIAEQLRPVRREVALKIIKLGMDTQSVIDRFEAERQTLAMMDHPYIAKVFDGGATEAGRPFFVMELVRGVRITDYCNEGQLSPRERLILFVEVCHAIQHAHQKGIIHRDIKPSNVLVTGNDHGRGPAPKVIDFGIAKATDQALTDLTAVPELSAVIGTPAYMSPEQIEMGSGHMDTRADIYSLGVLLYELLTGQTPFPASLLSLGIAEFRRVVCEEEPKLPSALVQETALPSNARPREQRAFYKLLHGELDWIVMKCLEKDRARRYATANDLAADIERFLDGEPILARPPSQAYRLGKFLKRHRVSVAAVSIAVVSLIVAAIFSLKEARRALTAEEIANAANIEAQTESKRAQVSEAHALLNEYVADITVAHQALAAGNFGRANYLLGKHVPKSGHPDVRSFEWGYLSHLGQGSPHRVVLAKGESVRAVAFSPKQDLIAVGGRNSTVILDASTSRAVAAAKIPGYSIAFAPDGDRVYIADPGSIHQLDLSDGKTHRLANDVGAPIALAPGGERLAAANRDRIRLFKTEPWARDGVLFRASSPFAFSPDGSHFVSFGRGVLQDWNMEGSDPSREVSTPLTFGFFHQMANILAFSADGSKIFSARDRLLTVIDRQTGEQIATIPSDAKPVHTSTISTLAISPDGKVIATGSWDHSIQLWDAQKREHLMTLQGHLNEVWSLAISPDGKTLLSGAKDGGVYLWPMTPDTERDFIAGDWQPLRFSPDERSLVAVNRQGRVVEIAVDSGEIKELWEEPPPFDRRPFNTQFSASSDLQVLARVAAGNRTVQIFDRGAGRKFTLPPSSEPGFNATLSPDGHSLLVAGGGASTVFWDLRKMTSHTMAAAANRVLFTADSQRFVLLPRGSTGTVWNCATRILEREIVFENAAGAECAISPDNRTLAVAALPDISNTIEILDLLSGESLGTLAGHKQGIRSVAFSADGKTIASASSDGIKLWNVATLQETLSFPIQNASQPIFSQSGAFLALRCRVENRDGIQFLRAAPSSAVAAAARN